LLDRRVDVVKVRAWWTARCGVRPGSRQTQVNIKWFPQPLKAINYVTGYLTKGCWDAPDWVVDHGRVVRMLNSSSSVQSWSSWLRLKGRPRSEPDLRYASPTSGRSRTRHRTLRARLAACGSTCVMLAESLDRCGKVVRRTALCSLPMTLGQVENWLAGAVQKRLFDGRRCIPDFEMVVTQWGRRPDSSWVPEILSSVRVRGFIVGWEVAQDILDLFGGSSKGECPLRLAG